MHEENQEGARPQPGEPAPALPRGGRARGLGDGTLLSRYECKYAIAPELVPAVRRYISTFVRPDAYAARQPRLRYPISSVYLDSADLALYRMNLDGSGQRFKLRVRTYDDDPATPAFFEIKHRHEGIVRKVRARVPRADAAAYLRARSRRGGEEGEPAIRSAGAFVSSAIDLRATPIVRVRYDREAYESVGGDPVRVTFDADVEYALSLDGDLSMYDGRWRRAPIDGVVLEVKFTDLYPSWIQGLVDEFELERMSIAKYARSIERALREGELREIVPEDCEFTR